MSPTAAPVAATAPRRTLRELADLSRDEELRRLLAEDDGALDVAAFNSSI